MLWEKNNNKISSDDFLDASLPALWDESIGFINEVEEETVIVSGDRSMNAGGSFIVPSFSESSSVSYSVGDYVYYNNLLHQCITATTGGTFIAADWIRITSAIQISEAETDVPVRIEFTARHNVDQNSLDYEGILWTWQGDLCTVQGTSTDITRSVIFNLNSALPDGMRPGGRYRVYYHGTEVLFQLYIYKSGITNAINVVSTRSNATFTLPDDAVGALLQLVLPRDKQTEESVFIPRIESAATNAELQEDVENISLSLGYASMPDVSNLAWQLGDIDEYGWNKESIYVLRTGYYPISSRQRFAFSGVRQGPNENLERVRGLHFYNQEKTYLGNDEDDVLPNSAYVRFTYGFSSNASQTVAGYGKGDLISEWGIKFLPLKRDIPGEGGLINLFDRLSHNTITSSGITWIWKGRRWTANGVLSGTASAINLFNDPQHFPQGLRKNLKYHVDFSSQNILFQICYYTEENQSFPGELLISASISCDFIIPNVATGLLIRLITQNSSINETVREPVLMMHWNVDRPAYYALGDSITAGSIHENGNIYTADIDDQIPTRIARATGVRTFWNGGLSGLQFVEKNLPSITYPATVRQVVNSMDLSNVDLFTLGGGGNDKWTSLGSADNLVEGTVCYAVNEVIEDLIEKNPRMQIVMYGVTPAASSNNEVYTKTFSGGWSIEDYDTEIGKLCARHGIPYINWRECTHYWRWMSLCEYAPEEYKSHPSSTEAYGQLANYLAGKVSFYFKS